MAIQTINATIQMRHGREEDFDPDQMVVGEWAISEDTRYIRMCVSQGVCVRIALYNAFEGDMEEIIKILEECRTIQEAVERIQSEIGHEVEVITALSETARNAANTASQKASEAAESANSAGASADTATQKANDAKTSADSATDSKTRAGVYADLAQESVENASGYATTASAKATEAIQSAIAASGHADRSGVSADSAADSALESESYAHGDTGTREGENTDNALYYKGQAKAEADRAKAEADRASGIVGIGIATADKAGIVKPDGKTLTVDPDGTLHSQAGTVDYNELENRPSINGVTLEGNKTLSELGIQPEGDYAPIESPVLTGTPKAPTPPENTNNTQIATTAFVKTLISNLINGAPETLDTLKEIADALGKNDDAIKALNDNLNGNILTYNESEDAYYIQHGADAVPKKLGSSVELTLYGSYSGNSTITLPDNLVDKHFILIPTTISGTVSAGEYKNDSKPFSFSPAISKNGKTLSITGCSYSATLGIALTMWATVSYGIYYW